MTYYFSDCQSGASAGCVVGNNSNAGTSAAPKQNLSGININGLPAGSRLLFARGGAWANFAVSLDNRNATLAAPLVFDAWGTGAQPVLRSGASGNSFVIGGAYGNSILDGGYAVRNLKLEGGGGGIGVFVHSSTRGVTLESLEISGFGYGLSAQNIGEGNQGLVLRNSNIHHNSDMGVLGDAIDLVIEGNTFANNNFSGSSFSHAIYLGGHGRNGLVRNNTFTNNSAVNGLCTGGNFTVHGQWDGLVVEGNTITQERANGGCYGISINGGYNSAEYFRNLVVRGNTIANVGGCGICLTSAPNAVVENNLIVHTQATYLAAILIPANPLDGGDDADTGATIRNNTIYFAQSAVGAEGVTLRANSGSNIKVASNLVYFAAATGSSRCFAHTARSNFNTFDNNLCFQGNGAGTWSQSYNTLTQARAAGFDSNGQSNDPMFVALPSAANRWSDALQAGSPARDAGNALISSAIDRLGVARVVPNIGARE